MKQVVNRGFTLIELVVVIIVLGILAVVALPKFINLGQDAHDSTAKGTFAAFTSGVSLYHSCWLASGNSARVENLQCYGDGTIDSTSTGFPLGTSTGDGSRLEGSYCKDLWYSLLDNDLVLKSQGDADAFGDGTDVVYWYRVGNLSSAGTSCYYNYIADDRRRGEKNWQLNYYPSTGETRVTKAALAVP